MVQTRLALAKQPSTWHDAFMVYWHDPVAFLSGCSPAQRRAFAVLGIHTVGDLLETIPRRYEDYSVTKTLAECQDGEQVTVRVTVKKTSMSPGFRQKMKLIRVVIEDASGTGSALFFNQPWLMKELVPGREVLISGVIHLHDTYGRQLTKPTWRPIEFAAQDEGSIQCMYRATRAMPQKTYRRFIQKALTELAWPVTDPVPEAYLPEGLMGFREAYEAIHEPKHIDQTVRARRRLAYNEALLYRLAFAQTNVLLTRAGGVAIPFSELFAKKFVQSLPFPLTGDQKRAIWQSLQDMQGTKPMRRLLQGDVGSGKTVVAGFVGAHTCQQGHSTMFLAPTDILAGQHAQTFRRMLAPYQIPLFLLTRTQKKAYLAGEELDLSKAEVEARALAGGGFLVGTHALFVQKRLPPDVGFVVIDEQHRFGVEQRQLLAEAERADGRVPHFLSMTATPIPRSLALTLFGDLDVSSLKERPKGRKPITSFVCLGEQKAYAYQAVREAAERKEASFVVCPLIDPSDTLGVASVTEVSNDLQNGALAGLRLGVVHGKLPPAEKEAVMSALAKGELDVLVSTTVIEVGVDIPHATVMVIEGAERFGMAQLHQLRGRVGRSDRASSCYFLTDAGEEARERLDKVAALTDGFDLAEEDFRRRGAGNIFGTEQSGSWAFKIIRWEDLDLLQEAHVRAKQLFEADPDLRYHEWIAKRVNELVTSAHLE